MYYKDLKDYEKMYLLLYVDDMLIACKHKSKIDVWKEQQRSQFEMKDLGLAKEILRVKLVRNRKKGTIFLSQEKYVQKVLDKFRMAKSKPIQIPLAAHFRLSYQQCRKTANKESEMSTIHYSSVIGYLMYAIILTRPDISYAVCLVSRYKANPGKEY